MNEFRKEIAIAIGFILILALLILLLCGLIKSYNNNLKEAYVKKKETMELFVGKKIVVGRDTLIVVNFSVMGEEYTLSNGCKVTETFVRKAVVQ